MLGALGDDGAAQPEAGGVRQLLDGGDLTQFFDNSGEHSVSLPSRGGDGGDAQIGADSDGLGHIEAQRPGDRGDSGVGEGGGARAEQYRGEIADDLVDRPGGDERAA